MTTDELRKLGKAVSDAIRKPSTDLLVAWAAFYRNAECLIAAVRLAEERERDWRRLREIEEAWSARPTWANTDEAIAICKRLGLETA